MDVSGRVVQTNERKLKTTLLRAGARPRLNSQNDMSTRARSSARLQGPGEHSDTLNEASATALTTTPDQYLDAPATENFVLAEVAMSGCPAIGGGRSLP